MTKKASNAAFNLLLVISLSLSLLGILPAPQAAASPASGYAATQNTMSTSASLTALDFPMAGATAASAAATETSALAAQAQGGSCARTITADVVALDQPFYYNRLGAIQANGMIYALRRDVVDNATGLTEAELGVLTAGNVSLRTDKRPRPLVLRMNEGDCLQINFTNLLDPNEFVFKLNPDAANLVGGAFTFPNGPVNNQVNDQPLTRAASVHVDGLNLVGDIGSDGSFVGQNPVGPDPANPSGLVAPGGSKTYTYYAAHEGTNLLYSMGATLGGEGAGSTRAFGLFGAINVQKAGAEWYRSQLTRAEMDLATIGFTVGGDGILDDDPTTPENEAADNQPILNYDAVYPVGTGGGKDGLPIINVLNGNEIVHSDINAIITGPGRGRFDQPGMTPYQDNLAAGDRNAPYREFTVIFHDEIFAVQAFPSFYKDPVLGHTLHGVRDGFPINYGSGGIGSEIIANRLGVGPMWDCTECKYEEFFLTSFTVGDPAMIVDIPANADMNGDNLPDPGVKATKALYPDDPSNVHHAYLNDRVKFRNLHAGPKEHHIFHLHAHQWLFNPDDPDSNYLDGQAVGPGSGYTYEIAYGGSGNRNKTVGDSIFHCHFYPHFAQGMWELWRVHDTFERGTLLDAEGRPAPGSRALPDGEIAAGTPIPGVVPMPTIAMAPMPDAAATIVASDLDGQAATGIPVNTDGDITTGVDVALPDGTVVEGADAGFDSSQFDANGDGTADIFQAADMAAAPASNPGYPWFTPGLMGHRPATPALDMAKGEDINQNGQLDDGEDLNGNGQLDADVVWGDGGLPRHVVTSGPDEDNLAHQGAPVEQYQTRLDFNKILHEASAIQIPETGTPSELVAMAYHAQQFHPSFRPDGSAASFETNSLPAAAGAPFADPCRADNGGPIPGLPLDANGSPLPNRTIKGANIEMPITLNKVGWYFQQQRFEALWEDVVPTLAGARAPQPMIMRLNSTDCAEFWHTNLVPNVYQLDDYQVRTPTDIIGQHIHLVKFDVMSADGSANGWNYEDGTLSPDEVRERIEAFNNGGGLVTIQIDAATNQPVVDTALEPVAHPFFGPGPDNNNDGIEDWLGARTTIQRWYADPLLERSWDGGVGTVFTHDHYGPSTHQQVGLYSTLLVEPEGSVWRHNETGEPLATRHDGGPSGWQAIIEPGAQHLNQFDAHREFYFEFADFQHAYERGGGALGTLHNGAFDAEGNPIMIPSYADFPNAINPSFRLVPPNMEDIFYHPAACPGPGVGQVGLPRPCPEAISADDPGTYALNFRNEPIGLRVFNGQLGAGAGQTPGLAGDLAFAYQSRTDRAIPELNVQPETNGISPYPPLTADVQPGDPWTPMLRVYMGDKVRIRVQVGAHEEEHNFTIPGLKWRQEPNSANSGWKNSEFFGIDEYFNLDVPIVPDTTSTPGRVDYIYTVGAELEGMWNGVWGILRSYSQKRNDLFDLPNNSLGRNAYTITNEADFNGICPLTAPLTTFDVTAVRAVDVLGSQGIVYNNRTTAVAAAPGGTGGQGPLIDPTALMYVLNEDLVYDPVTNMPIGLQPGAPTEPLILRVNAGDCVEVNLTNALPADLSATEMPGWNALPPIVHKDENADGAGGITSFNANDLTPSSQVGLTPQLLAFDPRTDGGFSTGLTTGKLVTPGTSGKYTWYAGDVTVTNAGVERNRAQFTLSASPVEFGAVGLMPADRIKGSESGFVGAMVVEPQDACWVEDPGTRAQATVWKGVGQSGQCDGSQTGSGSYRDFVTVMQNDVNLRYGGDATAAGGPNCTDPATLASIDCAVPNIAAEGPLGIPEDPQDSGQKAINYGADPLWFRLGIAPNTPFGLIHRNLALVNAIRDVFSNGLVGGDPQTEVYRASPLGPDYGRFRVVMPGGHARGVEYTLHGHEWQRQPYVNGSSELGDNPISEYYGTQEGINPTGHWDFVVKLGGYFKVVGDYLFRDQASFGSYQGLWGLLRFDNTAPVVADTAVSVPKYGSVDINLLSLATDLDGDAAQVGFSQPAFGSLALTGAYTVTYTSTSWPTNCLDAFTCPDSFTYVVTDTQGLESNPGTVTVSVLNTAPVAEHDSITIQDPDVSGAVDLLLNDFDAEGDLDPARSPVVSLIGEPLDRNGNKVGTIADAVLDVEDGRTLTYTPQAGLAGVVRIKYTVRDESGATSNEGTVRVAVRVDNVVISTARYQEANKRWDISGTCSEPGNTITIYFGATTAVLPPEGMIIGTAVCAEDNTWSFNGPSQNPTNTTPVPEAQSYVSVLSIGGGYHDGFPVAFAGPNIAPVAVNDDYGIAANALLDTALLALPGVLVNDIDADFDPLTAILVTDVTSGTLALSADGSFAYDPTGLFDALTTGEARDILFTYQASDGKELSNSATVTITVNGINDAPVAVDDDYTMAQGGVLTVPDAALGLVGVLANDTDADGDPLTAVASNGATASGGSYTLNLDGSFVYTPTVAFTGPDSFTYAANDGLQYSNVATVTVIVGDVAQPPVAMDDAFVTGQNVQVGGNVLVDNGNGIDSDPNGDLLTVSTVNGTALVPGTPITITLPSGATLTTSDDGSFTYMPPFNFTGTDSFTYVASDGALDSNEATVTITIEDTITVTSATYRLRQNRPGRWQIQGTISDATNTVTVYLCYDETCAAPRDLIGTANVGIDSTWSFNGPGEVGAPSGGWVRAVSSTGVESNIMAVTVR